MNRIGVLGLQGDFEAHVKKLDELGVTAEVIRWPGELERLSGLIIPGGESTTLLKLIDEYGFAGPLKEMVDRGGTVYGTCAGLILLARAVRNPQQPSLGLLDVEIERNGYGRQVDSFIDEVVAPSVAAEPVEGVFIRAPTIGEIGAGVEVLGSCRERPVLVRQDRLLACSFHPELSQDGMIHRYFLQLVRGATTSTPQPVGRSA